MATREINAVVGEDEIAKDYGIFRAQERDKKRQK